MQAVPQIHIMPFASSSAPPPRPQQPTNIRTSAPLHLPDRPSHGPPPIHASAALSSQPASPQYSHRRRQSRATTGRRLVVRDGRLGLCALRHC
eukprot:5975830-Prymnesium_polylepis.1